MVFEYTGDGCSVPKDVISVRFNDGLQKIGDRAFSKCRSLERIVLPSTVTEIGIDAFNSCCNLREVTFNEGLQKIECTAFYKCRSLERIILPSTVTDIGYNAFNGCRDLKEVNLAMDLIRLRLVHFTTAHH